MNDPIHREVYYHAAYVSPAYTKCLQLNPALYETQLFQLSPLNKWTVQIHQLQKDIQHSNYNAQLTSMSLVVLANFTFITYNFSTPQKVNNAHGQLWKRHDWPSKYISITHLYFVIKTAKY